MLENAAALRPPFVLAAALLAVTAALAQDAGDKSAFVRLLEGLLSTPERQVSLDGIEGAFSADHAGQSSVCRTPAVLGSRSTASNFVEPFGAYLAPARYRQPFGGGGSLMRRPAASEPSQSENRIRRAQSILIMPPSRSPDCPCAGGRRRRGAIDRGRLGAVTAEALALQLSVDRQDRAGSLVADLSFEPDANMLAADIELEEPGDGLLAEMLGLRGRPRASRSPAPGRSTTGAPRCDGCRRCPVMAGAVAVTRGEGGLRWWRTRPPRWRSSRRRITRRFAGEGRLAVDVARRADGALVVQSATLRSGGVDLAVSGGLPPDLVPESAELS